MSFPQIAGYMGFVLPETDAAPVLHFFRDLKTAECWQGQDARRQLEPILWVGTQPYIAIRPELREETL
jgi:hypothetical protein